MPAHHHVDPLPTTRIEALTDGMFAIVMTLLILDIKIPAATDGTDLWGQVVMLQPMLFSYLVSFLMLGVYWVGNHNQFHYIEHSDRLMLWLNLCFLLFVSFLPFTTSLLGHYSQERLPSILFGLNLIAIGIVSYYHWCYATTHHRLTSHDISRQLVRGVKRRILVAPAVSLIAMIVSVWNPTLSLVLYLLLPLYYIWPGKVDHFWKLEAVPHED